MGHLLLKSKNFVIANPEQAFVSQLEHSNFILCKSFWEDQSLHLLLYLRILLNNVHILKFCAFQSIPKNSHNLEVWEHVILIHNLQIVHWRIQRRFFEEDRFLIELHSIVYMVRHLHIRQLYDRIPALVDH